MNEPECMLCMGSCWLEEQEQTCPCVTAPRLEDGPRNAICPNCDGTGQKDGAECDRCEGLKLICDRDLYKAQLIELNGLNADDFKDCPDCRVDGWRAP